MKKYLHFPIVVAIVLIALVPVSTAFAAPDPIVGAWESIDVDGSYQTLTIGGGPGSSHLVRYYDFGASICDDPPFSGALAFAASAQGLLTLTGNELSGTMSVYCHTSPRTFWNDYTFEFTYDPLSDTLMDNTGVVWTHR